MFCCTLRFFSLQISGTTAFNLNYTVFCFAVICSEGWQCDVDKMEFTGLLQDVKQLLNRELVYALLLEVCVESVFVPFKT